MKHRQIHVARRHQVINVGDKRTYWAKLTPNNTQSLGRWSFRGSASMYVVRRHQASMLRPQAPMQRTLCTSSGPTVYSISNRAMPRQAMGWPTRHRNDFYNINSHIYRISQFRDTFTQKNIYRLYYTRCKNSEQGAASLNPRADMSVPFVAFLSPPTVTQPIICPKGLPDNAIGVMLRSFEIVL